MIEPNFGDERRKGYVSRCLLFQWDDAGDRAPGDERRIPIGLDRRVLNSKFLRIQRWSRDLLSDVECLPSVVRCDPGPEIPVDWSNESRKTPSSGSDMNYLLQIVDISVLVDLKLSGVRIQAEEDAKWAQDEYKPGCKTIIHKRDERKHCRKRNHRENF